MPSRTDGRQVDVATHAHVRRTAVKAVRAGMAKTAWAAAFGVGVHAVNEWMAADKVGGLRALAEKRRGHPVGAGLLSRAQTTRPSLPI